ncbi:hypothetical protein [Paenibacillus alginolyticus]|uniref:hypothetical protein n=1 Tax=Paenibacillus alginolyticus TaxID=59839 RepID=UPI002DBE4682|nr:hypothetical protein [Paenibacillus alginolyticus]MEC0147390.1 hypothetical protein [Paenibacillus alginolyticus]
MSEKPEIDFSAERPYCISSLIESEESSVLHSYPQIGILHNFLYSKKTAPFASVNGPFLN